MTVHTITQIGDPILRTPAEPVTTFDKALRRLIAGMAETMLAAPGAGLAAPQIGVGLRVFTYHVAGEGTGHVVNARIEFPDDEIQEGPEGCLSIPGLQFVRRRREHAIVHGQDMSGDPMSVEAHGFLARCFQHEVDHLDGTLYVDGLEAADRVAAMRAIRRRSMSLNGENLDLSGRR